MRDSFWLLGWVVWTTLWSETWAFSMSGRNTSLPTARRMSRSSSDPWRPSDSYVPDGLTREEYDQLKQKEADELASKNFGAWGPRFKQGERPEGDWMVWPSLWTSGFSSSFSSSATPASRRRRAWQRAGAFLRTYIPPFTLSYLAAGCVLAAISLLHTWRNTTAVAFTVAFRHSIIVSMYWKSVLARSLLSIALVGPATRYLEWASRKRLWTQRRTWLATVGVMLATLVAWGGLVALLRPLHVQLGLLWFGRQ